MATYRIEHYLASDGRQDLYVGWLRQLRDSRAKVAIIRRTLRVEQRNFGDQKFCRDGVWELRIDVGQGCRVYCALPAQRTILLLCCGDKGSQNADVDRAVGYWQDWQRRNDDEKQTP
jgi:putative addiction module killer protein